MQLIWIPEILIFYPNFDLNDMHVYVLGNVLKFMEGRA